MSHPRCGSKTPWFQIWNFWMLPTNWAFLICTNKKKACKRVENMLMARLDLYDSTKIKGWCKDGEKSIEQKWLSVINNAKYDQDTTSRSYKSKDWTVKK